MIVINFKTYKEATGYRAIELARICKKIQDETQVRVVVVPQLADLRNCVETGVDCWVQHIDAVEQGKNTGWVNLEDVEEAGARGTLLNHSEHRLSEEVLTKTLQMAAGRAFEVCVCVNTVEEAQRVNGMMPDFIAYEPAELIGSRDRSVSSEKSSVIEQVVRSVSQPVLIGAGVHSVDDVKTGLKLGARGVLLATDVVLSPTPEEALRELAQGFNI